MFTSKKFFNKSSIRVLVSALILACFLVMGVSAGSITLSVPADVADNGGVLSIPVYIEDANDIVGIEIDISNNVPGAVITLNQDSQPLNGYYVFNSNDDNEIQHVVWFTTSGFTADSQELFTLQVQVTSDGIAEVPITITPVTIVGTDGCDLTVNYPVTEVDSFPLTDSVTGKIIYGKPASKAAVATSSVTTSSASKSEESIPSYTVKPTVSPTSSIVLPTQSSNAEASAGKLTGDSTEVPTNVPSVPEPLASQGSPVSTQASPLGILPLLGVGFAGLLLILKK